MPEETVSSSCQCDFASFGRAGGREAVFRAGASDRCERASERAASERAMRATSESGELGSSDRASRESGL